MADWPPGVGREIHDELDSTNSEALRRAAAGAAGPLWILARRQAAARGRRGRVWAMPPGAFAASLLMRPDGPATQAALRSFVAALALREALVELTGRPEMFALKWPNDVLLAGRKLAGILLETGGPTGGPLALAIGVGVNLAVAPEAAALEAGALAPVSLREATGLAVAPEAFLDRLAPAFDAWERRLRTDGFASIRDAWLAHAARVGEPILARVPGREIAGRFETIDADGALVVATPSGRMVLPAAEVFFTPGADHAARH